jgi:Protein of unknown function (DUF664)
VNHREGAAPRSDTVAGEPHSREIAGMISLEDLLWYVEEALAAMSGIVADLGDELANQRIDAPDANSPFAVLTHCLGVIEYWGGEVIADRPIDRDREAEFRASGPVADLLARVAVTRAQLTRDLAGLDPAAAPRGPVDAEDAATPVGRTQGGVLLHIYEELAQHRGQLEVTRDVLLRTARR